ncbi:MAG: helix-turn-helix domain-containing protein [Thermodesulfobacteriota bacterium]|nr:helix-turn-helix domain-containing protein [Thermodesulfobacteriota bacterium]
MARRINRHHTTISRELSRNGPEIVQFIGMIGRILRHLSVVTRPDIIAVSPIRTSLTT